MSYIEKPPNPLMRLRGYIVVILAKNQNLNYFTIIIKLFKNFKNIDNIIKNNLYIII